MYLPLLRHYSIWKDTCQLPWNDGREEYLTSSKGHLKQMKDNDVLFQQQPIPIVVSEVS